jgi:hypothetical protein
LGFEFLFELFGSLDCSLNLDVGFFLEGLLFKPGKFGFEHFIFRFDLVDLFKFRGLLIFAFFLILDRERVLRFILGLIQRRSPHTFKLYPQLLVNLLQILDIVLFVLHGQRQRVMILRVVSHVSEDQIALI